MVACTIHKNAAGQEIFGLSTSLLRLSKPRQKQSTDFLQCSKVFSTEDKNLKLKKDEKTFKVKENSCDQLLNKLSPSTLQELQQNLAPLIAKLLESQETGNFHKNSTYCTLEDSYCDNVTQNFEGKLENDYEKKRLSHILRHFLRDHLNLEQYLKTFEEYGILDDVDLRVLDEDDLKLAGISSQEHRHLILSAVPNFVTSEKYILYKWLQQFNLESTWVTLLSLGVNNLGKYSSLELNKTTKMFETLQLNSLMARKRFLFSIKECRNSLKSSNLCHQPSVSTPGESVQSPLRTAVEPTNQLSPDSSSANQISPNSSLRKVSEKPLAFGYWAKPQGLKGATSDFLCVQAALRGSADPSSPAYQLEFMVDSGSDVVTCRPEVLSQLGVKLLGKIESRGIHATVEKEIYQGYLQLGGQIIPVEVMPESYESVGNQVMRHFKHYITNDTHYWLQANHNSPNTMTSSIS